ALLLSMLNVGALRKAQAHEACRDPHPHNRPFSLFSFPLSRFGIISRSRSGRVCEAATYRCCAPDGVDAARTDANACPEAARRFTGQGISLAERLDGDARGRTNS